MGITILYEEDMCPAGTRVMLTRFRNSRFNDIATVSAVQPGLMPLENGATIGVWYYELQWSTGQRTWHLRNEFDMVAE